MELIAIAGTVVALAAVIVAAVVAVRPQRAGTGVDHIVLENLEEGIAQLRTQLEEVRRDVAARQAIQLTEPEPPTEEVRRPSDHVDDHLEEQIYFALRGVIMAATLGAPMKRVFCPGAVRCDDAHKRAILLTELNTFLQKMSTHRVGGRHRPGSWHFRFHIYAPSGMEKFTQDVVKKLRGYIEDRDSLRLAQIMGTDPAAYVQLGQVVLVRTGFDFHVTVLSEQGMTEFAQKSRLDYDPSLILGELNAHMTERFSLVRPERRGK